MRAVNRWVCDGCGAVHFVEVVEGQGGRCLTCRGSGRVRKCELDEGGAVRPVAEK